MRQLRRRFSCLTKLLGSDSFNDEEDSPNARTKLEHSQTHHWSASQKVAIATFRGILGSSGGAKPARRAPKTVASRSMSVAIPVISASEKPEEPCGDLGDHTPPSAWFSEVPAAPPVTPHPVSVAPVAGMPLPGPDDALKKNDSKHVMGSLEFSIDEEGEQTCCWLLRRLSAYKRTWVVVTVLVILMCYAFTDPVLCSESVQCEQHHLQDQDLQFYSGLIVASLTSVLMHEAASVILTRNTAQRAIHIIPDIKESLIPATLLCATFAVLIVENLILVWDVPWFAHAAKLGDKDLDGTPVYTVFYAEWIINVPILLVLAGYSALGRPLAEVAEPLIITNVYILLAWMAHFIPNLPLRYIVVAVTFLMYFRASWTMCQWVWRWRRRNPKGFLLGRPLLSFVLIVVFGIYGIVYLCRMHLGEFSSFWSGSPDIIYFWF
eukprot:Skav221472  [mRNA]  locus=scaffold1700:448988:450557:+ [translate_table: standard]